jgi:prepilin-type N-terminal cleavage/methylation domain-containing protein
MRKKYFKNKKKQSGGFTIIEMMISIAIFLIVVTIGMESLLNASFVHQKSQDTRSILDSLNFMMDDMSRNIRTGSAYNCVDNNGAIISSCPTNGAGISFTSSDSSATILNYYFDSNNNLQKISGSNPAVQLNPDGVKFATDSGFTVTGAALAGADNLQPFVTIRLVGSILSKGTTTSFSLQTSVSQRQGDI